MSKEDFIYALLLLLSLIFSYFVKIISKPSFKKTFVCFCGIFTAILSCRLAFLHSFITISVNIFIVRFLNAKYIHILSFIWCFSYLTFFRLSHNFGLPPPINYLNAIQLLTTLRMVGLAFEMRDFYKQEAIYSGENPDKTKVPINQVDSLQNRDNTAYASNIAVNNNVYNRRTHQNHNLNAQSISDTLFSFTKDTYHYRDVSLWSLFTYSYCFIGLFTGPYYTYKTYEDMVNNQLSRSLLCLPHLLGTLKFLPFCLLVFFSVSFFYSLDAVKADDFVTSPLLTRLSYMVLMFALFRARLYIAWLLSELVCKVACLGMYPALSQPKSGEGPVKQTVYFEWLQKTDVEKLQTEYNFETVRNLNLQGCELSLTTREGMRSWNMSVQYWLATYIYKRAPFKMKFIRTMITMVVSAFWHGVHPGYYLSFVLMPFYLMCEDLLISCFNASSWAKSLRATMVFKRMCWLIKMRLFEYTCMGFLLLSYHHTTRYWGSIYYCGHFYIPVVVSLCLIWKLFQYVSTRFGQWCWG